MWIFFNSKNFEGKWKGKGYILIKNNNEKLIKQKVLTKLIIKKINNFSFRVFIRNFINNEYSNLELLGFLNKQTNVLEFQNLFGTSQFYFDDKHLINSFNENKNNNISTGTIKLIPDKKHKKCKSYTSSSVSSFSSSSSSSFSTSSNSSCSSGSSFSSSSKC